MVKTSGKTGASDGRNNLIPGYKTKVKGEQPTPEQKKAGRDRRRNAQRAMDLINKYQEYNKEELEKVYNNPKTPMVELLMIRYIIGGMKDPKLLIDYMDRHVPKAPQKMELTGDEGEPIQQSITIKIKK